MKRDQLRDVSTMLRRKGLNDSEIINLIIGDIFEVKIETEKGPVVYSIEEAGLLETKKGGEKLLLDFKKYEVKSEKIEEILEKLENKDVSIKEKAKTVAKMINVENLKYHGFHKTYKDFRKCSKCGCVESVEIYSYTDLNSFCEGCGSYYELDTEKIDEGTISTYVRKNDGMGFINISYRNDGSYCSFLDKYPTEKEMEDFMKEIKEEEADKEKSYISVWDEKEGKLVAIYGKLPLSYEEFIMLKEKERANGI